MIEDPLPSQAGFFDPSGENHVFIRSLTRLCDAGARAATHEVGPPLPPRPALGLAKPVPRLEAGNALAMDVHFL